MALSVARPEEGGPEVATDGESEGASEGEAERVLDGRGGLGSVDSASTVVSLGEAFSIPSLSLDACDDDGAGAGSDEHPTPAVSITSRLMPPAARVRPGGNPVEGSWVVERRDMLRS